MSAPASKNPDTEPCIAFPRLALRVGFAGKASYQPKPDVSANRTPTLEEFEDRIRERLAEVLTVVGTKLASIAPGTPLDRGREPKVSRYFSDEKPLLRVVAGLCEGCDQLAFEASRQTDVLCPVIEDDIERTHDCLDTSQAAVIPFPFDQYRESRPESFRPQFDREAARCEYIYELDGIYEKPDPNDPGVTEAQCRMASRRRARGYRAQGQVLLRHCDILVAVADPSDAGKAGGTMETVRSALEFDLPVVFVDLYTQEVTLLEPEEKISALLDDSTRSSPDWQKTLTRWVTQIVADPDRDFINQQDEAKEADAADLDSESNGSGHEDLERESDSSHHGADSEGDRTESEMFLEALFFRHDLPPRPGKHEVDEKSLRERIWDDFWGWIKGNAHPGSILDREKLKTAVDRKFSQASPFRNWRDRARELNYHFSGLYRGAFLLNFALSVAAVLLASLSLVLIGLFGSGPATDGDDELPHSDTASDLHALAHAVVGAKGKPKSDSESASDDHHGEAGHHGEMPRWLVWTLGVLGAIKLTIVGFIAYNASVANSRKWNDLGIDTRFLAERLRALYFLPLSGSFQPPAARPTQYSSRVLNQSVVDWLSDTMTRSASPADFPEAVSRTVPWTDPESGQAEETSVPILQIDAAGAAAALRDQWIGEQILYHDDTARHMGHLFHWTETMVKWLSVAVILFVSIDVIILGVDMFGGWDEDVSHGLHKVAPWLVFLAALLPAAVAALNGIRYQSECQRLAERSAFMRSLLVGRRADRERNGVWKKFDDLFQDIANAESEPDSNPGAWAGEVLLLSESAARHFVEEAAEWSVLYDKDVPEQ